MLMLSNWPVVVEATEAVTNEFAWLYFCVWYVVVVVSIISIVTSFIIEHFQVMKALIEDESRLVPVWKVIAVQYCSMRWRVDMRWCGLTAQRRVLSALSDLDLTKDGTWTVNRNTTAEQMYEAMYSDDADDLEKAMFAKYDTADQAVLGRRVPAQRSPTQRGRRLLSHPDESGFELQEPLLRSPMHTERTEVNVLRRRMSTDEVFVEQQGLARTSIQALVSPERSLVHQLGGRRHFHGNSSK